MKSDIPVYICGKPSTFERVVGISSLTLAVHRALTEGNDNAEDSSKSSSAQAITASQQKTLESNETITTPETQNNNEMSDKLSNIEREGVTEKTFSSYFLYYFATTSSDGRQVLLKPNGDKIPVTYVKETYLFL